MTCCDAQNTDLAGSFPKRKGEMDVTKNIVESTSDRIDL